MKDCVLEFQPKGSLAKSAPRAVLVAGDEEYRSEETLPQLGKILAVHHGFHVTMLFSIDAKTGVIDPNQQKNIPGLASLADADLMVIFTRFRNLPDDQMKPIVDYVNAGKPIVGIRTATHAFSLDQGSYKNYSWNYAGSEKAWHGGFGRHILGETWINHHGHHGHQATRGVAVEANTSHPILRGVKPFFAPTDVYGVRLPLPGDSVPLVNGRVLTGMKSTDRPLLGPKNDPEMPIAWTKTYEGNGGRRGRVFTSTAGASQDFADENVRRMLVNACYWSLGRESAIDPGSDVSIVGSFRPTPFSFGGFQRGVRPEDHKLP